MLPAWREAPGYSQRERAALAWCETITLLADSHGGDDATYAALAEAFSEDEIVALTLAIIAINGWNRLNVGLKGAPAGSYRAPTS